LLSWLITAFTPITCGFAGAFILGQSTSRYRPQLLAAAPLAADKVTQWMRTRLGNAAGMMHLDEGGTVVRLHAEALRRAAATRRR
jgi:hypothetical protein